MVVQVGGGGKVLVHNFWGEQLCGRTTLVWRKCWRKRAVAQVMAQVVAQVWRLLVWRRFGASWLWWRRLGASYGSYLMSSLRQTCAKPAPPNQPAPNQLAPNLRHYLRHQLRHRPRTPPLAPNQGGASTKSLGTPKIVHQHLSTTANLHHHLRETPLAPNPGGAPAK